MISVYCSLVYRINADSYFIIVFMLTLGASQHKNYFSNILADTVINKTCLIHVTFKCIHSHSSSDNILENKTGICWPTTRPEFYRLHRQV